MFRFYFLDPEASTKASLFAEPQLGPRQGFSVYLFYYNITQLFSG